VAGKLRENCLACHSKYLREWRKIHPLTPIERHKMNCRKYTHMYLKRGKLNRGPCEVPGCDRPAQMHHEDYDKPLEVRWFCRQHHLGWHMHNKAV